MSNTSVRERRKLGGPLQIGKRVMHAQARRVDDRPLDGQPADDSGSSLESGAQPSDARLVEQTRLGDRDAFGILVQRYERRLIRVLMRFVRDLDVAEELAQETFIRVYEKLDQFDPSRRFSPWLFRIGVNLTLDYHRRRKRRRWTVLFTDRSPDRWIEPAQADPRPELDLRQEVRLVIEQIPEKYRTVLILREMENFSTSEIAAILDRKEATIRWRLAEARNRFQEIWERRKYQEPT